MECPGVGDRPSRLVSKKYLYFTNSTGDDLIASFATRLVVKEAL